MNNDRIVGNAPLQPANDIKRARVAASLFFLAGGIGISSWAPLIPLAKSQLGLDDGALGILLLFFGTGAIVAMPLTPRVITMIGIRRTAVITGVLLAASLPCLLYWHSFLAMALCLFAFGAVTGMLDVALNQQAALIQDAYGRHLMSSFHVLYSLGCIPGSLGFGLLQRAGLSPYPSIFCISGLLIGIIVSQYPKFLQEEAKPPVRAAFGFLRGAVLLQDIRHFDPSFSGLGFSLYSGAMAVMRLGGDRMVNRIGPANTVLSGGMLATAGLLIMVGIPDVRAPLPGFVLIGVGCANMIPVFITTAGKIRGGPSGLALPAVIAMTYAGALTGSALIGFVARFLPLPGALEVEAIFLLLLATCFTLKKFN